MDVEQLAGEALEGLRSASARAGVPKSLQARLSAAVADSEREAGRRVLRLAVVGEFSTGKSSFLNTLLKTDLLSVDDRPTTAVLTRLRYGATCDLRLQARTGAQSVLPTPYAPPPKGERAAMLDVNGHWRTAALPVVRQHLRNLSTEEGRQSKGQTGAQELHLHFPLPILKAGLEIIDTPGTNVDIGAHRAITREAVEAADACVFLMDARNAFKSSEKQFLEEVRQSVGKCFFVVNKMDLLDPDEDDLDETIADWTDTLNDFVGGGAGVMYLVSSLGGSSLPPRATAYRTRLDELRADILAFMSQNRRRMIVQALLGRLRSASRDLGAEAVSQKKSSEEQLAKLKAARLTNPAAVTEQIASLALATVHPERLRVAHAIPGGFEAHKQDVLQRFVGRLLSYENAEQLKNNAGQVTAEALDSLGARLTRDLGRQYETIVDAAATQVATEYSKLYARLPFGATPRNGTPESIRQGLGALPVNSQHLAAQIQQRVRKASGGQIAGAVAGAAVGAALLGPVGVGLWRVGAALFAPSKEELARKAQAELAKALDDAAHTLVPQLQGYFYGEHSSIEAQLRLVVAQEVQNFAAVVQAAMDAHGRNERNVETQIAEIEGVRRGLEASVKQLEAADQNLRASLARTQVVQASVSTALVVDSVEQVATLCEQAVHLALAGSYSAAKAHLDEVAAAVRETPELATPSLFQRTRATMLAPYLNQARTADPALLVAMLAPEPAVIDAIPESWIALLNEQPTPLLDTLWVLALGGHSHTVESARAQARVKRGAVIAAVAAHHAGLSGSPECQSELVTSLRALSTSERTETLGTLENLLNSGAADRAVDTPGILASLATAEHEARRLDEVDAEIRRGAAVRAAAIRSWLLSGAATVGASIFLGFVATLSVLWGLGLLPVGALGWAAYLALHQRSLKLQAHETDPRWAQPIVHVLGGALLLAAVAGVSVGVAAAMTQSTPSQAVPNASSSP